VKVHHGDTESTEKKIDLGFEKSSLFHLLNRSPFTVNRVPLLGAGIASQLFAGFLMLDR
jgi:hypothetical protein